MRIKEYPKKIIKTFVEIIILIPFVFIIKFTFNDPWVKMLLYTMVRLLIIEILLGFLTYYIKPVKYSEYSTYNLLKKNKESYIESLDSHIKNASEWLYMRLHRFLIEKYIFNKINKIYDINLEICYLGTTTEIFQIKINGWICVFEPDISIGSNDWTGYILMYHNDVLMTEFIYYNNRGLLETISQIMLVINPNKVIRNKLMDFSNEKR
jgi:hypothetical protein